MQKSTFSSKLYCRSPILIVEISELNLYVTAAVNVKKSSTFLIFFFLNSDIAYNNAGSHGLMLITTIGIKKLIDMVVSDRYYRWWLCLR